MCGLYRDLLMRNQSLKAAKITHAFTSPKPKLALAMALGLKGIVFVGILSVEMMADISKGATECMCHVEFSSWMSGAAQRFQQLAIAAVGRGVLCFVVAFQPLAAFFWRGAIGAA